MFSIKHNVEYITMTGLWLPLYNMNKFLITLFIVSLGLNSCSKKEEAPEPVSKNQTNSGGSGGSGGGGTGGGGGGTGGGSTPPTLTVNSVPQFWGKVNGQTVHIISGNDGMTHESYADHSFNQWHCWMGHITTAKYTPFFGIARVDETQPINHKPSDAEFLNYFKLGKHNIQNNDNSYVWMLYYWPDKTNTYDSEFSIANISEQLDIIDMAQDTDPITGKLRVKCLIKFTAYFRFGGADIKVTDAWTVAHFVNE